MKKKKQMCNCGRTPAHIRYPGNPTILCDVCWDIDGFVRRNEKNKIYSNEDYSKLQFKIEKYRHERIKYYNKKRGMENETKNIRTKT